MRLQQHQSREKAQDQDIGPNAVFEILHKVFLFGDAVGKVNDDGQLRDFRGLKGQHACLAQPAGGAVLGDTHPGHQHQGQQENRHIHEDFRHAPEPVIVYPRHCEHSRQTHQGKQPLPL